MKPARTFAAIDGSYMVGVNAPSKIGADLDTLAKMFDPNAVHANGEPGGIQGENIRFRTIDLSHLTLSAIQGISGFGQRVFNVRWYGAAGDGATDDTAAIQQALDEAANAGGGVVFVPPGTYLITSSLTIGSKTTLIGAAKNAVTIKKATYFEARMIRSKQGYNADGVTGYDGDHDIVIQNITWDDNYTAGAPNTYGNAIDMAHCERVRIINCHFKNIYWHAADLVGVKDVLIEGCSCEDSYDQPAGSVFQIDQAGPGSQPGVNVDGTPCKNVRVVNCRVWNCPVSAVHLYRGDADHIHEDILIQGNQIYNCANGVYQNRGTYVNKLIVAHNIIDTAVTAIDLNGVTSLLSVVGNLVFNCSSMGIDVGPNTGDELATSLVAVTGNVVQNIGHHGIIINYSQDFTVGQNVIYDINGTTGVRNALTIYSSVSGIVSGNVCVGTENSQYGIQLSSGSGVTCSDITLIGNRASGFRTAQMHVGEIATNIKAYHNLNYLTENSGTAIIPSGSTSVTVAHGLRQTPSIHNIQVTPTNNLGSASKFWVDTVTSSNFTIHVNTDPGPDTATFVWSIDMR